MNAPLPPDGLRQIRALAELGCPLPDSGADAGAAMDWPADERITMAVIGLSVHERRSLEQLIGASARRRPLLLELDLARAHEADVVIVDGADPAALAWRSSQRWLADRAVIWIGRSADLLGHTSLARPIAWPTLPIVLSHALRHAPRGAHARGLVARRVQPHAPAVMVLSGDVHRRERLGALLEAAGRRATLARTAREGLAALHAAPYETVILAGGVPDLDRLALCGRVRALERRIGRVPLLLLDEEPGGAWDRLRARMAGYDEVAPMPASQSQLRSLLDAVRAGPRQAAAAAERPDGELHGTG